MKKQNRFRNALTPILMAAVFFLIMKYQDTEPFQNVMRFFFNPDASLALPQFWQNYRTIFFGAAALILILYYKPVWLTYRNLVRIYRSSPGEQILPEMPVLQAGYIYQQNQTATLVTFLVDLCRRGVSTLHYTGGDQPWSISRNPGDQSGKTSPSDKQILDILFQSSEKISLKASFSDPNPDVKAAAEKLFKELKEKNRQLYHKKKSTLPGVIFLIVVLAEIPFYIAAQSSQMPAVFVLSLFSAALAAVPAYVISRYFPSYFNEPELPVLIKTVFAFLLFLISHLIMFSGRYNLVPWWSIALFPDLAAIIITAVYKVPLLPENHILLQQIIGYRRFINRPDYLLREEDLPWTLALGLYTGFFNKAFRYGEKTLPEWIHSEEEKDLPSLIKLLHQTLPVQVDQAVNGMMKSRSTLVNRDISKRY